MRLSEQNHRRVGALRLSLLTLACAMALGCSRDPEPAPVAATTADASPASPAPAAVAVAPDANRMDCMGANGIRMAIDFNGTDPRAFEYASSNPADRSIICRYVASEGDATSTWERAADGTLSVSMAEDTPGGAAKFVIAPNAEGWRVQIVATATTGPCYSTQPPDIMDLAGRPGQECSLTAQGGIAAAANAPLERQQAFCAPKRFDVAQAPSQSQDPAAVFRELPEGIVGMSAARREEILAGGERLEQLDPGTGFLGIERRMATLEHRADADGYRIGTFRDSSGRTVVAVLTMGVNDDEQGIWRADAKGWERVGCELIDDYLADHQYVPVAAGKALEVFDPYGQSKGELRWDGDRFVAAK